MEYYILLASGAILIVALSVLIARKTHDTTWLIGIGMLYYWSLYGAWSIVIDKLGGTSGKHYQYLELKLFTINLDTDYIKTLIGYSVFIITIECVVLLRARLWRVPQSWAPLRINHYRVLSVTIVAGIASIFIMIGVLGAAWASQASGYLYTRSNPPPLFTLHQFCNRLSLIPAAIGLAVMCSGKKSLCFINIGGRACGVGYACVLLGMGIFTLLLGNKNEVFLALASALLIYVKTTRRPCLWMGLLIGALGLWFLALTDTLRGTPLTTLADVTAAAMPDASDTAAFAASSNEAYGAHFSLYGALKFDIEPRFGYSVYSLLLSIVPRVLWHDRPESIYSYYASAVGAIGDQGYSIHHATGWYLNFGAPGIIIGGIVLALVWSYSYNRLRRLAPTAGVIARLFAVFGPWVFIGYLPAIIRAGPEAYKGWILEAVAIPVGVFAFGVVSGARGATGHQVVRTRVRDKCRRSGTPLLVESHRRSHDENPGR